MESPTALLLLPNLRAWKHSVLVFKGVATRRARRSGLLLQPLPAHFSRSSRALSPQSSPPSLRRRRHPLDDSRGSSLALLSSPSRRHPGRGRVQRLAGRQLCRVRPQSRWRTPARALERLRGSEDRLKAGARPARGLARSTASTAPNERRGTARGARAARRPDGGASGRGGGPEGRALTPWLGGVLVPGMFAGPTARRTRKHASSQGRGL